MLKSLPKSLFRNYNLKFRTYLFTNPITINRTLLRMSSSNSVAKRYEIKTETIHREPDHNHLLWVDCEMTGLNVEKDRLLEIAIIITDNHLNELDRLGPLVFGCDQNALDSMNDCCKTMHAKTGLIAKSLKSKLTIDMIDQIVSNKLNEHSIKGAILAGNSISFDNLFIRKYLHKTTELLHYRSLDVSSIKILKERWYPELKAFKKERKHQALDDIIESINELKYYKEHIFK